MGPCRGLDEIVVHKAVSPGIRGGMANRKETGDEGMAGHVNFGELAHERIRIPLHKPHRAASTAESDRPAET